MELLTALPFQKIAFRHWGPDDREGTAVIAKGTFGVNPDGQLHLASAQAPLVEGDVFHGDPASSSLKLEQDLAPFKPRTDVTFALTARAPGGNPLPDWPVSVEIAGRAFYGFHVRGPSAWQRQRGIWRLSPPDPVHEIPIRYELAYGGQAPERDQPQVHQFNPAGTGFVTDHLLADATQIPAPQIGDLSEFMADDIRAPMTVHGLGPIAKSWLPRRAEAGTFDDHWKTTRHPRMPKDYSFAFWNAAPQRLQLDPHLRGGEHILLRGFHPRPEPQRVILPFAELYLRDAAGDNRVMSLTDVQIDLEAEDPALHRVVLVWRAFLDLPPRIETLTIETKALEAPT